jgi:MFS family permease
VLMWFPLKRPLRYGMIGMATFAIPLTVLGVHPAVVLLAIAAFVAGAGAEVFSTGWNVAMMENVPGDKLSRVYSYDMLGSYVVLPVGTLVYGWLVTHSDVVTVLIWSGAAYAVIALLALAVPSVWRMGRPAEALGS